MFIVADRCVCGGPMGAFPERNAKAGSGSAKRKTEYEQRRKTSGHSSCVTSSRSKQDRAWNPRLSHSTQSTTLLLGKAAECIDYPQ